MFKQSVLKIWLREITFWSIIYNPHKSAEHFIKLLQS